MGNEGNPKPGFVDTHIHILPGIDDGPEGMDDAVAMAQVAAAGGTAQLIATPHANYQFEYQPEKVKRLCDELRALVPAGLEIYTGCELHLSYENVQAALAHPRTYSLNGSRYLLVEFPEYFDGDSLQAVLTQLMAQGLTPVLAHPERNANFQRHEDLLLNYLRRGCLAQLTASSFAGRFGKRAQQFSRELLEGNLVCVVASDGHSARQRTPLLASAFEFVSAQAGDEMAQALFIANPKAMLLDRELALRPDSPPEKRRGFWAKFGRSAGN